ncbi:MAG: hypothetical protein AAF514_05900 [Verrucomicrobiota bacterium]
MKRFLSHLFVAFAASAVTYLLVKTSQQTNVGAGKSVVGQTVATSLGSSESEMVGAGGSESEVDAGNSDGSEMLSVKVEKIAPFLRRFFTDNLDMGFTYLDFLGKGEKRPEVRAAVENVLNEVVEHEAANRKIIQLDNGDEYIEIPPIEEWEQLQGKLSSKLGEILGVQLGELVFEGIYKTNDLGHCGQYRRTFALEPMEGNEGMFLISGETIDGEGAKVSAWKNMLTSDGRYNHVFENGEDQ